MKKRELSKYCRKNLRTLRTSISMYCNQLKGGSSPEYDDEFNSLYSYVPTFFDKAKKPSHALIRTAFSVCFTDNDWLRLGKEIWVTRRTGRKYRLNFLVNTSDLEDIKEAERRIKNLIKDLKFEQVNTQSLRFIIKRRIPKLFISTKEGIYVYSYPTDSEDSLTLGYLESLKNFGNELAVMKFTEQSFQNLDIIRDFNESNSLELSNNIIQFYISNPIDKYLTFSLLQINPNHIYDIINRNIILLATKFLREVFRRNNLLDTPFENRIDIYKDAFENPLFGGLSAKDIIHDIQFGNELKIHPLFNAIFREITNSFDPSIQIYIYNAVTGNIIAADFHHTFINELGYSQIRPENFEYLMKYQSKIIRAISSNSINAAVLDGGDEDKKIFIRPIKYRLQFRDDFYRISPPTLECYIVYIGTLEKFNKYEAQMKWVANIVKQIIPFCDPIYLRPEIDHKGRRTTRTMYVNKIAIQLPDFAFLNKKKYEELIKYIHDNRSELLKNTILKMIEIISYCRETLSLKYSD